jgi:NADH:ubiquinone oxidoreductase subunit F (NADH-binding)
MLNIVERLEGEHPGTPDVDLLLKVAKQMQNKCLCPLGEFATMAVVTGIERFPQDFKKAVEPGFEPVPDNLKNVVGSNL